MINVSYVKFYQAVQIGKHLETHLGGAQAKIKGLSLTWDQGLMRVEAPGCKVTFIPTANIMFFHAEDEQPAPAKGKKV